MSIWEFSRLGGAGRLDEAARAMLLAGALLRVEASALAGTGIFGVGIIRYPGANTLQIAIISNFEPGSPPRPLAGVSSVRSVVEEALTTRPPWLLQTFVLGVTTPEFEAKPGDAISGPISGTIGCKVSWGTSTGFLTAGHVGKPVSATITTGSTKLGTVVYSNDPKGNGTKVEDDVALVRLLPGSTLTNTITASAVAGPGDTVSITRAGGASAVSATIMGYCCWVYFPAQNGTCGDTYFTTRQVTAPGDSGSPVLDSASNIIGHVIGASKGFCTYIQDVRYQMREIASKSGFAVKI
jgi:hypothetical protein